MDGGPSTHHRRARELDETVKDLGSKAGRQKPCLTEEALSEETIETTMLATHISGRLDTYDEDFETVAI